jgi:hypothetical protein
MTDLHVHACRESGKSPYPFHIDEHGGFDMVDLAERLDAIAPKVGNLKGDRVVKVDPTDALAISKALAAIADRYAAMERRRYESAPIHWMAAKRIHELERYLEYRYGQVLPDDDAGREDLVILLNHVAQNRHDPRAKVLACILGWAPWMAPAEAEALADKIVAKPRKYKATTLGRLLRLTREEQVELDIETIRPFDKTDTEMEEERQRKDRGAKTAKRRSDGVVPREEYLAKSKTKTEPWKPLNMSRSTYYRKLKAGEIPSETGVSGVLDTCSYSADTVVSPEPILVRPLSAERIKRDGAMHRLDVLEGDIILPGGSAGAAPPPIDHIARALARAFVLEQRNHPQ